METEKEPPVKKQCVKKEPLIMSKTLVKLLEPYFRPDLFVDYFGQFEAMKDYVEKHYKIGTFMFYARITSGYITNRMDIIMPPLHTVTNESRLLFKFSYLSIIVPPIVDCKAFIVLLTPKDDSQILFSGSYNTLDQTFHTVTTDYKSMYNSKIMIEPRVEGQIMQPEHLGEKIPGFELWIRLK